MEHREFIAVVIIMDAKVGKGQCHAAKVVMKKFFHDRTLVRVLEHIICKTRFDIVDSVNGAMRVPCRTMLSHVNMLTIV